MSATRIQLSKFTAARQVAFYNGENKQDNTLCITETCQELDQGQRRN